MTILTIGSPFSVQSIHARHLCAIDITAATAAHGGSNME